MIRLSVFLFMILSPGHSDAAEISIIRVKLQHRVSGLMMGYKECSGFAGDYISFRMNKPKAFCYRNSYVIDQYLVFSLEGVFLKLDHYTEDMIEFRIVNQEEMQRYENIIPVLTRRVKETV